MTEYMDILKFKLALIVSLNIGSMTIYITWVQYLNGDWMNLGNSNWLRAEVILLDSDLIYWIWPR